MTAVLEADQRRKASHPARPAARIDEKAAHEAIAKRYPKLLAKLAE